jgi:hypothetical protein
MFHIIVMNRNYNFLWNYSFFCIYTAKTIIYTKAIFSRQTMYSAR